MTYTPAAILPCDHNDDRARPMPMMPLDLLRVRPVPVPPLRLLRALSGPDAPPPVVVEFLTLADVADRVQAVGWV